MTVVFGLEQPGLLNGEHLYELSQSGRKIALLQPHTFALI